MRAAPPPREGLCPRDSGFCFVSGTRRTKGAPGHLRCTPGGHKGPEDTTLGHFPEGALRGSPSPPGGAREPIGGCGGCRGRLLDLDPNLRPFTWAPQISDKQPASKAASSSSRIGGERSPCLFPFSQRQALGSGFNNENQRGQPACLAALPAAPSGAQVRWATSVSCAQPRAVASGRHGSPHLTELCFCLPSGAPVLALGWGSGERQEPGYLWACA